MGRVWVRAWLVVWLPALPIEGAGLADTPVDVVRKGLGNGEVLAVVFGLRSEGLSAGFRMEGLGVDSLEVEDLNIFGFGVDSLEVEAWKIFALGVAWLGAGDSGIDDSALRAFGAELVDVGLGPGVEVGSRPLLLVEVEGYPGTWKRFVVLGGGTMPGVIMFDATLGGGSWFDSIDVSALEESVERSSSE